jgi:hypothetical protein
MIRADLAQIDMSARMPTTRPAPTATPLMAETIGVTPQRSIQERSNSGSRFVDNRSRDGLRQRQFFRPNQPIKVQDRIPARCVFEFKNAEI